VFIRYELQDRKSVFEGGMSDKQSSRVNYKSSPKRAWLDASGKGITDAKRL
jgi:hypothetical protein